MENKKEKVVTNLNIGSGKALIRVSRGYNVNKNVPVPTLKKQEEKKSTSYNLLPVDKMPTLKMVLSNARKKRG